MRSFGHIAARHGRAPRRSPAELMRSHPGSYGSARASALARPRPPTPPNGRVSGSPLVSAVGLSPQGDDMIPDEPWFPLRTERLLLREFREADFDDVHAYARDPQV